MLVGMPVSLHHIVIDAHDVPGAPRSDVILTSSAQDRDAEIERLFALGTALPLVVQLHP